MQVVKLIWSIGAFRLLRFAAAGIVVLFITVFVERLTLRSEIDH